MISRIDLASFCFCFQEWIRSMNAAALISLPSKVHLLCGTKMNRLERMV